LIRDEAGERAGRPSIWRRVQATVRLAVLRDPREFVSIAAEALWRYKLRTALSVLGVVLGIAAVIAMMSVSDGARREALQQVQLLGLNNLVVRNRGATASGVPSPGLTAGDAKHLVGLVPLTQAVSPVVDRFVPLSRIDKASFTRVLGVGASYQTILHLNVARGRFLSSLDERDAARVCVVGAPLARDLFAYRDPIGESIRIDGKYFRVVGVLADERTGARGLNALAWRDLNQSVLVPLPALSGRSLDITPDQHVDEIWLQASDGDRVEEIGQILDQTMARLHHGVRDVDIVVPRELLAQRYQTQRTFSVVVGSVAALSLIVGGIGIMNIMLTSVIERTSEIGLRRAVGATRRDVAVQFLTESLFMTLTGGVIGIALGVIISWGITFYAGWKTEVSLEAIVLACAVSFATGVGFGLYPATTAARLAPVDALHYE
jgi:putative ABC transport system permease protein